MSNRFHYDGDLQIDLMSYRQDCAILDTSMLSLESMCRLQDSLESVENMPEVMLDMVKVSVESFLSMGRIGATKKVMPSLESFSREHIDPEYISNEAIGEGIKNIFTSIIKAIRSAFSWMGGMIKRIFKRNKSRDEKIEKLEEKAEQVKEEIKQMSSEEKASAPSPRDSDGWMKKVELTNPSVLKNIVTSRGLMDKTHLDRLTTEMIRVFKFQEEQNRKAMQVMNSYTPENNGMNPPFPKATDSDILKALGNVGDAQVFASEEYGNGVHVVMVIPRVSQETENKRAVAKAAVKWANELQIRRLTVRQGIDYEKYKVLENDLANPDKLIETAKFMSKMLNNFADKLESFQQGKERFMKNFEERLRKEGTSLFSSSEKKTLRDELLYWLNYFKKTMDEPAMSVYGMCDGIVGSYVNIAAYVMHYNHTNGNKVELSE